MQYDYLIVGSGLFGATFANLAKKAGKNRFSYYSAENDNGSIKQLDIENNNARDFSRAL